MCNYFSRLSTVNRTPRLRKDLVLFLLTLIILFYFAANRAPDYNEILETKKLVLREKGGAARAVFEIARAGQPKLTFYGKDSKKVMIEMSVDDGRGPVISLSDVEGNPRLLMRTTLGPEVDFCNENGKVLLSVAYYDGGYGAVIFRDSHLATKVFISSVADGESHLDFIDNNNRNRIAVGIDREGDTKFQLIDRNGGLLFPKTGSK